MEEDPMGDAYRCFEDLAKHRVENIDFRICVTDRASPVTILAPHGGKIEAGTSEIAASIAGAKYSLYCFEGLMSKNNFRWLHITSASFDEKRACELVERSDAVIAVHGRRDRYRDKVDARTIWLGGRDTRLRDAIGEWLKQAHFAVTTDHDLPGIQPENICNRGRTKAGVQLEIPRTLREEFLKDRSRMRAFAAAVQGAIDDRKVNVGPANRANLVDP
jgi:phage replication-related protein YjqB (UPF0714/DUF867 family)